MATELCGVCGREPSVEVVIRWHVGMLIAQRLYKVRRELCRDHGLELWRQWTGLTVVQGWWGYISFFANIFTILMNLVALVKLLRLRPPVGAERSPRFEDATGEGWGS